MKTAVSVPDELFERADRLAKRLSLSRSELYSRALAEFLARRDPVEMTAAWDEVCEDVGVTRDEWVEAASSKILGRSDW
jgi:predicted transcriptional regulator